MSMQYAVALTSFGLISLLSAVTGLPTSGSVYQYDPFPNSLYHTPSYLKPCHSSDKKFNLCVKAAVQNLFLNIANGSSELHLPAIDPLVVPKLEINEGAKKAYLHMTFRNVSFIGLAQARVISVRSNLEDKKVEVALKYPYLNLVGQYNGDGAIKDFPVVGNGPFMFNMTDASAVWIIYFRESESYNSEKYLMIDQFLVDLIPAEISAKFGDKFDEDANLASVVNAFFNENSHEFFNMAKPQIMTLLSNVFSNIANQILSRYPSEILLPS